jgi:tetratricopeptide (TPR) repeat protein
MRPLPPLAFVTLLAISGCAIEPFQAGGKPATTGSTRRSDAGSAPVLSSPPEVPAPTPGSEPAIDAPTPPTVPRERPKAPAATLGPASKALVTQAQAQRRKGDLPGATQSLERALRIEPNNPLLWIEMGRLRMDQRNYPQAENLGRKALAMSVGDDHTQSQAWQLISDSLRARGKNVQAQEAADKARALVER